MIEQDAERYAKKRRDQMGATLRKKTSRPTGSNVIFESRESLLAVPSPSNVMEHKNRWYGINRLEKDEIDWKVGLMTDLGLITIGDFYKSPRRGETIHNTVQAEGAVPWYSYIR